MLRVDDELKHRDAAGLNLELPVSFSYPRRQSYLQNDFKHHSSRPDEIIDIPTTMIVHQVTSFNIAMLPSVSTQKQSYNLFYRTNHPE